MQLQSFWILFCAGVSFLINGASSSHVNLLKIFKRDLSKFKDVTNSMHITAYKFGPQTNDIIIPRKKAKKVTWNIQQGKDVEFAAVAKLDQLSVSGKSMILSVVSPSFVSNKLLEIYIQKTEHGQAVEGEPFSFDREDDFTLGVSYQSENGRETIRTPLKGHFKVGEWFTLVVRFLEDAQVEILMNCETMKTEKVAGKLGKIPSFAEIRLSQDVEEDIWSSDKIITNRFVGEIKSAKFLFGEKSAKNSPCARSSDHGMEVEGAPSSREDILDHFVPVSLESLFEDVNNDCFYDWKTYKSGETWEGGACQSCQCKDGKVSCHERKCNKHLTRQ